MERFDDKSSVNKFENIDHQLNNSDNSDEEEKEEEDEEISCKKKKEIITNAIKMNNFKKIVKKGTYEKSYFTPSVNEITYLDFAVCYTCLKVIRCKDRNTSGMIKHLLEHSDDAKNMKLHNFSTDIKISSNKKKKINEQLSILISRCYLPFNIINHPKFIEYSMFLVNLNSQMICRDNILPDESTIRKNVMTTTYNAVMNKKKEEVATIKYAGITLDLWYNKVTFTNYLGITSHYYEKFTKTLKRIELGLILIEGKKTHEKIKKLALNSLREIYPESTLLFYTTDNGSNVKKPFDENHKNILCAAHNLSLMLKYAIKKVDKKINVSINDISINNIHEDNEENDLNEINDNLKTELFEFLEENEDEENLNTRYDNVEMITESINNYSQISQLFKFCRDIIKYIKISGSNNKLNLKNDVITRFNSSYIMLNSIFKSMDKIIKILQDNKKLDYCQSLENSRLLITQLCLFLENFHMITEKLSSDNEPVLYLVIPFLYTIEQLCIPVDGDLPNIRNLKLEIWKHKDLFKYNNLHVIATFLNPSTKTFDFIKDNNTLDKFYNIIIDECHAIENELTVSKKKLISETNISIFNNNKRIEDYFKFDSKNNNQISQISPFNLVYSSNNNTTISSSLTDRFIKNIQSIEINKTIQSKSIEDEINEYIADSNLVDIINYWETGNKNVKLPRLYKLFEMTISLQATEIPSERVFSKSGLMSTYKRYSLGSLQLKKLTFINFNS